MKELNEENLLDLLCQKATNGLNTAEATELKELEKAFPDWADDNSFELAAAAINLSVIDFDEQMPAQLRSKILANAESFFAPEAEIQETFSLTPNKKPFWQSLGWGVAALACIALAVNLYLTRVQKPNDLVTNKPPITQTPTPQLTDAQKRDQLLALNNTVKLDMAKADPKKGEDISGDVVWNNAEQRGYIRLRGLPVNDPNQSTYQLWIFDETRDEKYPISAGTFNVNENGEVLVPMNAEVKVNKPKMIAVTKEKPGGVVVSDRKGLLAIAKV